MAHAQGSVALRGATCAAQAQKPPLCAFYDGPAAHGPLDVKFEPQLGQRYASSFMQAVLRQ